ncbi:hypothetical protein HYH03_013742 [Edaphochlamys debaryana]|uniref:Uncharacterized protein n=1 Tax=Edaphochlamys debaryana TaxID=47281 RepID=A0A836BU56_9CHLO|nr:hypothetical protein HYH03_013742 [Edaphochlamys debaryana]|eukprot:KAG2487603.1 hypothetical protein HYH03_013742 [Edaphochlamys debaryana]
MSATTSSASASAPLLPAGVGEQLEELGIASEELESSLRASRGFAENAEASLATLRSLNSRQRVRQALLAHPEVLCAPLESWLAFLTAYGVSSRDFFRLLSSHPDLFTRGSLFNAGSVIAYLQSLGLTPRDVSATVIPRCPALLLLDVPGRLRTAATFLREHLGLDQAGLRDLLVRCPRLLSLDVGSQLGPRLAALLAAGEGLGREEARRLVASNASLLLGDAASALQQRLGFLTGVCGFSTQQAVGLLAHCPELLSLTLPNLSRKWRFLTERMHCGSEQVLEYPQVWAKSLLLDIGPRYSYVLERRLLPLAPPPVEPPLAHRLLPLAAPPSAARLPGLGLDPAAPQTTAGPLPPAAPEVASATTTAGGVAALASRGNSGGGSGGGLAVSSNGNGSGSGGAVAASSSGRQGAAGSGAGSGGAGSSGGGGARGGAGVEPGRDAAAAPGLSLRVLLDSDDLAFVERVWRAGSSSGSGSSFGSGSGTAEGSGSGSGGGSLASGAAAAGPEAWQGFDEAAGVWVGPGLDGAEDGAEGAWAGPDPEDYQRFRSEWMETEGVRWSGVNAVGSASQGSW